MSVCATIDAAWCNIDVQISWQSRHVNDDGLVGMRDRVYARMMLVVAVELFLCALTETLYHVLSLMCMGVAAHTFSSGIHNTTFRTTHIDWMSSASTKTKLCSELLVSDRHGMCAGKCHRDSMVQSTSISCKTEL